MDRVGFNLYLFFMVSWFLHFGRRFPVWGQLRLDLVIVILLIMVCVVVYGKRQGDNLTGNKAWRYLRYLVIFVFFTIPFVEWPGSVVKLGLENFVKAVVFFYFTVILANTQGRLRKLVLVFILCQLFRVAEPLYLHITEGYWGSQASMWGDEGMEMMNRLAGSRYDVINPNGLAFVIVFTLPLLHFLGYTSRSYRLLYLISLPFLIYALILTGSRSGLVALFVVVLGILAKARHKSLVVAIILCGAIVALPRLDADLKDRYLSIVSSDTKNAATAEGRLTGIERDLRVALRKPIVGHGLGTSIEATFHATGTSLRSHNLYAEIMQEIGFVGLFIFLGFMIAIARNLIDNRQRMQARGDTYILLLNQAVLLQYIMNTVFSLFSYGLSSYAWYLLAGLSVNISLLAAQEKTEQSATTDILAYQDKDGIP